MPAELQAVAAPGICALGHRACPQVAVLAGLLRGARAFEAFDAAFEANRADDLATEAHFLNKPFHMDDFARAVRAALDQIGHAGHDAEDKLRALAELDDAPLLNTSGRQAVERIASELKDQTGSLGLDFDTLTELMADLKTIDAQLGSSRPKTAIIRACLRSILAILTIFGENKVSERIRTMVGS